MRVDRHQRRRQGGSQQWTLRNGLGPLHRAELGREDAACMALELGDKLQGTPKVQIMVQRHGNIIVVPPGFPHHVRLSWESLEYFRALAFTDVKRSLPSLYLTACCNSIALCSSNLACLLSMTMISG